MHQASASLADSPLFFAAPIPLEIGSCLEKQRDNFPAYSDVRWVDAGNYHLSFHYLGIRPEITREDLQNAMEEVCKLTGPFILDFERIEIKRRKDGSGILWARFSYNPHFDKIVYTLYRKFDGGKEGKQQNKRPVPHITLARFKKTSGINIPAKQEANVQPALLIGSIKLMESVRSGKSVFYRTLLDCEF